MHQQALRSALDEFDAMKRFQLRIDMATQILDVRDAWKAIITANYEIGEKLRKAFDDSSPAEKKYKKNFLELQKNDDLLKHVYYSRTVGTHDSDPIANVDVVHSELDGDSFLEWGSLPEPKPDLDTFIRQHPKAKHRRAAVILRRFENMNHGKSMGWIGTLARHLGKPISTNVVGFTPSDAARYLVSYYETVFSQLAAFPVT